MDVEPEPSYQPGGPGQVACRSGRNRSGGDWAGRDRSGWDRARAGGRVPAGVLGPGVAAGSAGVITGVIAWASPFKHTLTPPCPFHALTGLWCPLCGGTRAVWAAAHGDFRVMVHSNALLPVLAVVAAWAWVAWLGRATGWWRLPVPQPKPLAIGAAVVLIAFTVVRNLPALSGVALAPPAVA